MKKVIAKIAFRSTLSRLMAVEVPDDFEDWGENKQQAIFDNICKSHLYSDLDGDFKLDVVLDERSTRRVSEPGYADLPVEVVVCSDGSLDVI